MDYYYRVPKSKFWTWVIVSFGIGLALGLAFYFVRTSAVKKQVSALTQQATTQSQQSSAVIATLQSQLSSAEATVSALTTQLQDANSSKSSASTSKTTASTTATLTVVSRTISPSTVATDGTIVLTAKVKGAPDKVTMRLTGQNVSFDQTFTLTKVSTSGSTQTWRRTVFAPKKVGKYSYYATALKGGNSATMPGATPSTLTVK